MAEGHNLLTEKEKQTLRLMVQGHDAKSLACELELSVHTINERLRSARRKLEASSSREAARKLLEIEDGNEISVDRQMGDADCAPGMRTEQRQAVRYRWAWIAGGVLFVSLIAAILALTAVPQNASAPKPAAQASAVDANTAAQATRTALSWLALVDQGRWEESWQASGEAFQRANTSKVWADISKAVRPPLGAVSSRTAINHERVPAPPHGYLIVRFRTSFANKPAAIETVSLEREGRSWKVVGYWIA